MLYFFNRILYLLLRNKNVCCRSLLLFKYIIKFLIKMELNTLIVLWKLNTFLTAIQYHWRSAYCLNLQVIHISGVLYFFILVHLWFKNLFQSTNWTWFAYIEVQIVIGSISGNKYRREKRLWEKNECKIFRIWWE